MHIFITLQILGLSLVASIGRVYYIAINGLLEELKKWFGFDLFRILMELVSVLVSAFESIWPM
jgi:hypothetical protein